MELLSPNSIAPLEPLLFHIYLALKQLHICGLLLRKSSQVLHMWTTIEKNFSSSSHAQIMDLRLQLQTIQKGILSIDDYLQRVKEIFYHLFYNRRDNDL